MKKLFLALFKIAWRIIALVNPDLGHFMSIVSVLTDILFIIPNLFWKVKKWIEDKRNQKQDLYGGGLTSHPHTKNRRNNFEVFV